MWVISDIYEADFGCEERMPGEPLMVMVDLESSDGRICRLQVPDRWLELQELEVGDEWPVEMENDDDTILKQDEFMDKYWEAYEEYEGYR